MERIVDLVGVQMDFGASKRGVSMGPAAIRYAGLSEGLERMGFQVENLGDIVPLLKGDTKPTLRNYEQVVDVNRRLYHTVYQSLEQGHFPVVLGGDHSIAAGSISAVSKFYGSIGIIWVDAHGDWNNEESSQTGNMHGMPFSAVCGYGPDCMVDFGQGPVFVDVAHCVQIGGRDIDTQERIRMKEAGVTIFPIDMIDELGMAEVMRRAMAVAGEGTKGIHLSFDVTPLLQRPLPAPVRWCTADSPPGRPSWRRRLSPAPRSWCPWIWWRSTPSWTSGTKPAFWLRSWSSPLWVKWYFKQYPVLPYPLAQVHPGAAPGFENGISRHPAGTIKRGKERRL